MSDYRYGYREIGPCKTRHEAIGRATIRAGPIHPSNYWQYVYAVRADHVCDGGKFFDPHKPADGDPENRCMRCGEQVEA